MRTSGVALAAVLLLAADAASDTSADPRRPLIEWSTWFRLAHGVHRAATPAAARLDMPAVDERDVIAEVALGLEATLPIAGDDVRVGPWVELRSSSEPVVGGALVFGAAPADLDLFQHVGEGVLILRAGRGDRVLSGAVAWGYRCPWKLSGPWDGPTRYMIGVRLVASMTRAVDDPDEWTATVGLETEPLGALRYLLGIRAWY